MGYSLRRIRHHKVVLANFAADRCCILILQVSATLSHLGPHTLTFDIRFLATVTLRRLRTLQALLTIKPTPSLRVRESKEVFEI